MPVKFASRFINPQPRSLVVCAGTVTCSTVEQMGSGFLLFKKLFDQNKHVDYSDQTWTKALQLHLDKFFNREAKMPSYMRIAEQNEYIGAIATVPMLSGPGLSFENFSDLEQEVAFIKQYKEAVRLAVLDAIELNRPLFIQPLGIGVYGWEPEKAAGLFLEAFKDADPKGLVDITIPLFDLTTLSKDRRFQKEFLRLAPELCMVSSSKVEDDLKQVNSKIVLLGAFNKIYEALWEGQTSFFKTPKQQLTYNQIISYVKANPVSRTAKAWELAQLHYADTSTSNQQLFKSIHQYTYDRSSCFSFFKQTKNFSGGYEANMQDIIDHASDDSRTGKIRNALMQPG